ncbi:venom allergen 3-like [Athalia rosae]|uniref:venom allergen 3-like n=1 Tax=Athalia rosae TaxID=37344 RepID=UPI0020344B3F|nr:venom allergen 3-like [Athalia rosae]
MSLLSWDAELATIAQRWGDQCAVKPHDDCREVERFQVGQNVATTWSSQKITDPIEKLVDGWYNEVKLFSCADVSRYRSRHATGHYTQLVWAKTSAIGCGKVKFWDRKYRMNTMRLICNYGPAGNFLGHPMYTVAEGGPRCSSGVRSKVYANIDFLSLVTIYLQLRS